MPCRLPTSSCPLLAPPRQSFHELVATDTGKTKHLELHNNESRHITATRHSSRSHPTISSCPQNFPTKLRAILVDNSVSETMSETSGTLLQELNLHRADLELLRTLYAKGVLEPESHHHLRNIEWRGVRCYNAFANTEEKLVLMRCQSLRADIVAAKKERLREEASRAAEEEAAFETKVINLPISQDYLPQSDEDVHEREYVLLGQFWDGSIDPRPAQKLDGLQQDEDLADEYWYEMRFVPKRGKQEQQISNSPAELYPCPSCTKSQHLQNCQRPPSAIPTHDHQESPTVPTTTSPSDAEAPLPTAGCNTGPKPGITTQITPALAPGRRTNALAIVNPLTGQPIFQVPSTPSQYVAQNHSSTPAAAPFLPSTPTVQRISPHRSQNPSTNTSISSGRSVTPKDPPGPPSNPNFPDKTVTPHKKVPLSSSARFAYNDWQTGGRTLDKIKQEHLQEMWEKSWISGRQFDEATRKQLEEVMKG